MKAAACIIGAAVCTAAWIASGAWGLAFVAGALTGRAIREVQGISHG